MELGSIRSQFIQTHLRRGLSSADQALHGKIAYEFRRYFEWFASSIEEADRDSISNQLRLLEDSCKRAQKQAFTVSTRP
jgi:hypothetical protein